MHATSWGRGWASAVAVHGTRSARSGGRGVGAPTSGWRGRRLVGPGCRRCQRPCGYGYVTIHRYGHDGYPGGCHDSFIPPSTGVVPAIRTGQGPYRVRLVDTGWKLTFQLYPCFADPCCGGSCNGHLPEDQGQWPGLRFQPRICWKTNSSGHPAGVAMCSCLLDHPMNPWVQFTADTRNRNHAKPRTAHPAKAAKGRPS